MIFRIMHIDIVIDENIMMDIINKQIFNVFSTIKMNKGTFVTKSGKTFVKLHFCNKNVIITLALWFN